MEYFHYFCLHPSHPLWICQYIKLRTRSHLTTTMYFFCRHVQTVTLVTMQPISDNMLTKVKNLCRCRQVRTSPYQQKMTGILRNFLNMLPDTQCAWFVLGKPPNFMLPYYKNCTLVTKIVHFKSFSESMNRGKITHE